ncbi:hypothetical protein CBOM_07940 [Ceraceosorus bombacis]|uniref:Uncharacterized protein n=1 Tax=Ceraceosorus bombacis TaxID=401625 RepID=A0A0P1BRE2_9BASI|nr:hypothetical protein CBOM_07940 [Ceraceosorus bombacis]
MSSKHPTLQRLIFKDATEILARQCSAPCVTSSLRSALGIQHGMTASEGPINSSQGAPSRCRSRVCPFSTLALA